MNGISRHFFGTPQFLQKVNFLFGQSSKEILEKQSQQSSGPQAFNPISYIEELNNRSAEGTGLINYADASAGRVLRQKKLKKLIVLEEKLVSSRIDPDVKLTLKNKRLLQATAPEVDPETKKQIEKLTNYYNDLTFYQNPNSQ